MNILIIEDEPSAAQRLESLLIEQSGDANILAKLDSVRESVKWLQSNPAPDLILMDIQLGDGLSFEIFEKTEVSSAIIFTTAYDEYALKAFKVNSVDYILKPVDKNELTNAIAKFRKFNPQGTDKNKMLESIGAAMQMLTRKYKSRFVIKVGEHLRSVEVSEIMFFFSQEKASFAITRDSRNHIIDFTMDQLADMIDPERFFRINRKYLVASDAILDMISYSNSRLRLILKNSDDKDIIVARERVQEFKNWMDK